MSWALLGSRVLQDQWAPQDFLVKKGTMASQALQDPGENLASRAKKGTSGSLASQAPWIRWTWTP